MIDKRKTSTSSAKRAEAKETAGFRGSAISTNNSTTMPTKGQVTILGRIHMGKREIEKAAANVEAYVSSCIEREYYGR